MLSEFGRKYTVGGQLKGPKGAPQAETIWIEEPGTPCVRLVTVVPEIIMRFKVLDAVVLLHDIPAHGLRGGDLGAVVEVYPNDGLEVEFVRPSGSTKALVTLKAADVRPVTKTDVLSVRAS